MTHYNVDYAGLEGEAKLNKALDDIKEYMGVDKFNSLSTDFKANAPDLTLEQFSLFTSLCGVQGYPIQAWYEYIYKRSATLG